jgi:hypothetical protein
MMYASMRLQREQFRVARASMKHCMGHGEPSGCVAQWRHSYLFILVKGGDEIPAQYHATFGHATGP